MDLSKLVAALVRRWWIVVIATTVGGTIGWYIGTGPTVILYEARATLVVDSRAVSESLRFYQRQVTTRRVLDRANAALPEGFSGNVLGSRISVLEDDGQFLTIVARAADPANAVLYANAVAEALIAQALDDRLVEIARFQSAVAAQGIDDISDILGRQLGNLQPVALFESAVIGTRSGISQASNRFKIAIGVLLGLAVGGFAAALVDSWRDVIRDPERLREISDLRLLGVLPHEPIMSEDAWPAESERYRQAVEFLRASINLAIQDSGLNLVITSVDSEAGKSSTSIALAVASASVGLKVLMVDADLRRGALDKRLNIVDDGAGLSNYLADQELKLEKIILNTPITGLSLVRCGPHPTNPPSLLESQKLPDLLEYARAEYDIVIIDTPPVTAAADVSIIAPSADASIVVVNTQRTRPRSLIGGLRLLSATKVEILGIVLNNYKSSHLFKDYYDYYGAYGTGDYYNIGLENNGRLRSKLGRAGARLSSVFRRRS